MPALARLAAAIMLATAAPGVAAAQPAAGPPEATVPGYWDPRRRAERVDLTRVPQIRFLTEDAFPPFNVAGQDGRPVGFNVDLARAICEELKLPCTIQVRRFDTLLDSLDRNAGDAVIASLAVTGALRRSYDLSDRYMATPARFLARVEVDLADATPETLAGRPVGVVAGTAHEAYLRAYFNGVDVRSYPTILQARAAIQSREVDIAFGDGVGFATWLNGPDTQNCCRFLGGPFTESRYFGEGLAIVMRRGSDPLRLAINYALQRLWERGVYTELYLKSFPISVY